VKAALDGGLGQAERAGQLGEADRLQL